MIPPEQIKLWRELCENATPGPWDARCREFSNMAVPKHIWSEFGWLDDLSRHHSIPNAAFISESRTALPLLLDEIERLQAELFKYKK